MKTMKLPPAEQDRCRDLTNALMAQLSGAMFAFATANIEGLSHPAVMADICIRAAINAAVGFYKSGDECGVVTFDPAVVRHLADLACATPLETVALDAAGVPQPLEPARMN